MVALAAPLPQEERAALEAARHLQIPRRPLKVIEGGKSKKRSRSSRIGEVRTRTNLHSCHDVPEGFFMCPSASCDELISDAQLAEEVAVCPSGHVTDWEHEERRYNEDPGGIALVGLKNTQQGDIAEKVIWDIGFLGKDFGKISKWLSQDSYHCPHDFELSSNRGLEVRSVSTRAKNYAFALTAKKKRRMDAHARAQGYVGQAGALVVLDFVAMTADVYLRLMDRAVYFERPKAPFVTGVPFLNPFAESTLAAVADDIPF